MEILDKHQFLRFHAYYFHKISIFLVSMVMLVQNIIKQVPTYLDIWYQCRKAMKLTKKILRNCPLSNARCPPPLLEKTRRHPWHFPMLISSRLAVSNLALWSIVIEPKCFAYKHATTSDMQNLVAFGAASKDQGPPSLPQSNTLLTDTVSANKHFLCDRINDMKWLWKKWLVERLKTPKLVAGCQWSLNSTILPWCPWTILQSQHP